MSRGYFRAIEKLPADPIFGIKANFNKDTRSHKVDLVIGAYRDAVGKPWIPESVKRAESKLQSSANYNHEYLPISGNANFLKSAFKILCNDASIAERVVSVQTLSGTGALHFSSMFLKEFYEKKEFYLSNPSWANHTQIYRHAGFDVRTYPYWDAAKKGLNIEGMLETLETAGNGSVVLLHSVAHNPTGLDPSMQQWKEILEVIKKKSHLPVFDIAYQGFASGSLEKDAEALNLGLQELKDSPLMICQSFAKNMGLYGERVGAFHFVLPDALKPEKESVQTQFNRLNRIEISNPPAYGSKIVETILSDPELYSLWQKDLQTMSGRLGAMRHKLHDTLVSLKAPGNWDHLTQQIGMFSFTGLNKAQVAELAEKHAVYMTSNGRISIAGLNESNVEYVAQSIAQVVSVN